MRIFDDPELNDVIIGILKNADDIRRWVHGGPIRKNYDEPVKVRESKTVLASYECDGIHYDIIGGS